MKKQVRFITGMHRSGTTWIGQAIQISLPGSVVHEPFNVDIGLPRINIWYHGPADSELIEERLRALLSGRASYRRRRRTDSLLKGFCRQIFGSRHDRELRRSLCGTQPIIILKDPFLIRLCGVLAKAFDAKGVVLVRHPAALVHSLRRMNWSVPQIDGQGAPIKYDDPNIQFAFAVGWLWANLYEEALAQSVEWPQNLIICTHEELCLTPLETSKRIFQHLDIPFSDASQKFLIDSTSGDIGQATGKQLHQMKRSGAELATAWKSSLPANEVTAVRDAAEHILRRLYPEDE